MARSAAPASDRPLRVLFLQGPPSPFWSQLGDAFAAAGHEALRVNVSTADALFWRRPGAVAYRGRFSRWGDWIGAYLARERVDAVIVYADRQPYHVVAAEAAAARGIPFHVVEYGYLRPDWLTLERGGMGAFSHVPDDPATIRRLAQGLGPAPAGPARFGHTFAHEALGEVVFGLVNALWAWPYPFYRMDRPWHPLIDYIGWLPRLARSGAHARRAEALTQEAEAGAWPFALVALQLEVDYQIRDNSAYDGLGAMIDEVVESFARHARPDRRLVFKIHPLDNGLRGWARRVARTAARHGVAGRVFTIDGGRLDALMRHADGVITVNSTVGLHALQIGRPVIALGRAIYDMPGLTHQGGLASFWEGASPVDADLARDLVAVLAAAVQVRGSFHHPEGRRVAQAEIVARVAGGTVNMVGGVPAFVPTPPRLPVRRAASTHEPCRKAGADEPDPSA